jgi:hypothetical protein
MKLTIRDLVWIDLELQGGDNGYFIEMLTDFLVKNHIWYFPAGNHGRISFYHGFTPEDAEKVLKWIDSQEKDKLCLQLNRQ